VSDDLVDEIFENFNQPNENEIIPTQQSSDARVTKLSRELIRWMDMSTQLRGRNQIQEG
jgi:hypothetical protein